MHNFHTENKFYTPFDKERLDPPVKNEKGYRSEFQTDRDRVIHSSEFRRLQGKTQVFLPGEYDFYRTRLTHSMEVSQIGRSICNFLNTTKTEFFGSDYYIDPDLVEAAALAHDLGHPPFGHAGERTLNSCMQNHGGFEGNAQTLRLLTETFYRTVGKRRGMQPTRAFIDSILKYKTLYSGYSTPPENHFLYDFQNKYLDFVFGGTDLRDIFKDIKELNAFRSIECQIMDWADDTAYAITDLVDSISGGFMNIESLEAFKKRGKCSPYEVSIIDEIIDWIRKDMYKPKFGKQIGEFITACDIIPSSSFLDDKTNRYKYRLKVDENIEKRAELYKKLSSKIVFQSPRLHQMEFKGDHMITRIFKVFYDVYVEKEKGKHILPDFSNNIIREEKDKDKRIRLICDYVAGMTDSYAMKTYRRLFDPQYSSLSDII